MIAARPRFPLGCVVATPGALEALAEHQLTPASFLTRHAAGDWGTLCGDDWSANEIALTEASRLLSSYPLPGGEKLWIITEADRSATTLLLPDEY